MDETRPAATLDARLFGLAVVVLALLLGLILMSAIVVFVTLQLNGPIVADPAAVYLFLAVAGVGLVTYFTAIPVVARRQREQVRARAAGEAGLFRAYAAETILRAAAAEGPAIVLVVGFMVTANWLVLAPVAVFAALLGTLWPTRHAFEAWADEVRGVT